MDWDRVESSYGIRLPRDYKEFVERFPAGTFYEYLVPWWPGEGVFVDEVRDQIETAAQAWAGEKRDQPDFPYDFYPVPGGLFPWAMVELQFLLCWDTRGADPDRWPVVACDQRLRRWRRWDSTMGEFLCTLLTDEATREHFGLAKTVAEAPFKPFDQPAPPPLSPAPDTEYWIRAPRWPVAQPRDRTDELRQQLPAPAAPPSTDWASFERIVGQAPPVDYRRFIETFGPGRVGSFIVTAPVDLPAEHSIRALNEDVLRNAVELRIRRNHLARAPLFTEPGGAIAWGRFDDGRIALWHPAFDRPDDRSVVVVNRFWSTLASTDRSATAYLLTEVLGR